MPKSFTESGAFGAGESGGGYNGGFEGGGSFTSDDSGGMNLGGGAGGAGPDPTNPGWGGYPNTSLAPGQSVTSGRNVFTNRSGEGNPDGMGGTLQASNINPINAPGNLSIWGTPLEGGGARDVRSPRQSFMFADGGEVPGMGFDPMAGMRSDLMGRLALARSSVADALGFGRKQNGLEQLDQELAFNPSQSDTGAQRPQPAPGPLPPTNNPFGKRRQFGAIDEGDGEEDAGQSMQVAGRMPTIPGTQSDSGRPPVQPSPGPLPPTANPFGRRASADEDEGGAGSEAPQPQQQEVAGAIPEYDDEEAA